MDELIKKYKKTLKYHNVSMALVIIGAISAIAVPVIVTIFSDGDATFWGVIAILVSIVALFINLGISASVCSDAENKLMLEIWSETRNPTVARKKMEDCGVRYRSAEKYIFEKERMAELNATINRENEEAENAYLNSQQLLAQVSIPRRCNSIPISDFDDVLGLGRFSRRMDWQIWREGNKLYLYADRIMGFPKYNTNSPYLTKIELSEIMYFKTEGSVTNEVRVSGGTVRQDRNTGRVTQSAIRTQNVSKDNRKTVIKLNIDGVVCEISSNYDAYDVLFSLMPEKEFERVRNS